MLKKWQWPLLLLVLLIGAYFRWTGLDWDGYNHYHPDERYITWVATTIEWPSDWSTAFVPEESTFNPFYWPPEAESKGIVVLQDQTRSFAYGHFPLYLGVATTRLVERFPPGVREALPDSWKLTSDLLNGAEANEFRHLTAVVRWLTGLVDLGTVVLVFLLGRKVWGVPAGLLSALFLSLNIMHIQLSHFFIVDPYLTFFITAALYFMVMVVGDRGLGIRDWGIGNSEQLTENGKRKTDSTTHHAPRTMLHLLLAAVFVGLAVGTKFSAVILVVPLAITLWFNRGLTNWGFFWRFAGLCAVGFAVFFVTNPFVFLDQSCDAITPATSIGSIEIPAINWHNCYLDNIGRQRLMVSGDGDVPFTRQYTGTLPFIYYLETQLRWGMGPLLGLSTLLGLAWVMWLVFSNQFSVFSGQQPSTSESAPRTSYLTPDTSHLTPRTKYLLILLAWLIPYSLPTGTFFVKFMRYLQPITPLMMIFAAGILLQWQSKWGQRVAVGVVTMTTMLLALAFTNLYHQSHPWVTASEWVYGNVEEGAFILSEQWDDPLPSSLVVDGEFRRRSIYTGDELTWLTSPDEGDDLFKLQANLLRLSNADYVVISTNRIYDVVPRLPERYPLSSQYHQLLFDGSLGYELAFVSGRNPNLLGLSLQPDTFEWLDLQPPQAVADYLSANPSINWGRADESFIVYDQPLVMIFENTGRVDMADMLILFDIPE